MAPPCRVPSQLALLWTSSEIFYPAMVEISILSVQCFTVETFVVGCTGAREGVGVIMPDNSMDTTMNVPVEQ